MNIIDEFKVSKRSAELRILLFRAVKLTRARQNAARLKSASVVVKANVAVDSESVNCTYIQMYALSANHHRLFNGVNSSSQLAFVSALEKLKLHQIENPNVSARVPDAATSVERK